MTHATLAQIPARGFTLRTLLHFDALTCAAMGLLLVFGGAALAPVLGLPKGLLFWAGMALFPCAALMFLGARQPHPALVWFLIAVNAAWVIASIATATLLELTWLGAAFVLAQAMFVAVLLGLEWRAAARARAEA